MQSKEQKLKSNAFPDFNKNSKPSEKIKPDVPVGKRRKSSLRSTEKEGVRFHSFQKETGDQRITGSHLHSILMCREAAGPGVRRQ